MIEHYYFDNDIFGEDWFSYPNLYKKVVEEFSSGSKFVEVGSWKGRSSCYMAIEIANSEKKIDFYCVDTWEGGPDHQGWEGLDKLYDIFLENMKPVEGYYFPLKITSEEASKKFKDKSLDFVFLDASHEYEDIKLDIKNWLPKLKPGGILAGHDYYVDGHDWFPGVKQAVNEELTEFETIENCFVYRVPIENKLKNFPSIHFISLEESYDRRNLLHKKFEQYNLKNINEHIFERYDGSKHILDGSLLHMLLGSDARGCVTSHLMAIKDWYFNTDEEYAFFCEDDLSLETVQYWNFTWEDFFNKLPEDWQCVQLSWVREVNEMFRFSVDELKIRPRCWCDWSACAYLIKRSFAKKLISNYYRDGIFTLDYVGDDKDIRPEWALRPVAETIIFSLFGPVYGFPLFVEDVHNCSTTMINDYTDIPYWNIYSHDVIIDWWKKIGRNFKP